MEGEVSGMEEWIEVGIGRGGKDEERLVGREGGMGRGRLGGEGETGKGLVGRGGLGGDWRGERGTRREAGWEGFGREGGIGWGLGWRQEGRR